MKDIKYIEREIEYLEDVIRLKTIWLRNLTRREKKNPITQLFVEQIKKEIQKSKIEVEELQMEISNEM